MTSTCPPRLATWMLLHLIPCDHDEALAGDLLECFRAGRSGAWYWRQVLTAIAIRWVGSLFRHLPVLFFAAAWAALAPAWQLLITRLYHTGNWIGPVWRLPWPWSTVCNFGLSTVGSLLFIWAGVVTYLLVLRSLSITPKQWSFGRAFAASLASYILIWTCDIAIVLFAANRPTNHGVDWRTLTFTGVISNCGSLTILMRLPYLIAAVCALLGAVPSDDSPMKLAE